jgi:fido (protein-threonine AMPylation protein)
VAVARRREQQMKGNTRIEKREKGNALFLDPAYIHRLTDEYRRARTVSEATAWMNIGHVYSSVM